MTKLSDISEDIPLPIWDHIYDLRTCFIKILLVVGAGVALSFFFYDQIFAFLTIPYQKLSDQNRALVILSPLEGLSALLKTCFWVGLTGTSPFWLGFVFQFIAPACQKSDRRALMAFLFFSLFTMGLGFAFAYYLTIPLANRYLLNINEKLGVNFWSLSEYIHYSVLLLLANGLAFEFCLLLFFSVYYGWVSKETLKRHRKGAIVIIFIISAILTPPDVLTQLLLALPLMGLYELAILLPCRSAKKEQG